jgi:hypothetical protein
VRLQKASSSRAADPAHYWAVLIGQPGLAASGLAPSPPHGSHLPAEFVFCLALSSPGPCSGPRCPGGRHEHPSRLPAPPPPLPARPLAIFAADDLQQRLRAHNPRGCLSAMLSSAALRAIGQRVVTVAVTRQKHECDASGLAPDGARYRQRRMSRSEAVPHAGPEHPMNGALGHPAAKAEI